MVSWRRRTHIRQIDESLLRRAAGPYIRAKKRSFPQCAFSVRPIRKPRSLRLLSVVPQRRLVQLEVVWRGGRLSSAERATTQERLIARCGFYALGGHELILLRGPSLFPPRPLSRIVTILNLHSFTCRVVSWRASRHACFIRARLTHCGGLRFLPDNGRNDSAQCGLDRLWRITELAP
jgi:hypothetical protein